MGLRSTSPAFFYRVRPCSQRSGRFSRAKVICRFASKPLSCMESAKRVKLYPPGSKRSKD